MCRFIGLCIVQPDNNIDPGNPGAARRLRQIGNHQVGDILQLPGLLVKKMMVIGRVRIKVRAVGIDNHLPQEAGAGKLMQSIVDSGQRHADPIVDRLGMQLLGGDMAVAAVEEEFGQGKALLGRPQASILEEIKSVLIGTFAHLQGAHIPTVAMQGQRDEWGNG